MGHFSMCCGLSGLPITGGTPAMLVLMEPSNYGEKYLENELFGKYGTSYLCSNETTRVMYTPVAYPIRGVYDSYGRLEDIVECDNTAAISERFGLTIQEIVDVVTSGRKDDGYDDNLDCVKDSANPGEYGKPRYQKQHSDMLRLSAMWIHAGFYDLVTSQRPDLYLWDDSLHMGEPCILEFLGFKKVGQTSGRYKDVWEKDGFQVNSDGTWISGSIYSPKELKKKATCEIDISELSAMGEVAQTFKIKIPWMMKEWGGIDKIIAANNDFVWGSIMLPEQVKSLLLDRGRYSSDRKNPMMPIYLRMASEGKLLDDAQKFWRFDHYMYSMGKYYNVIGTSPQDGSHKDVLWIHQCASAAISGDIKRYDDEEE